MKKVKVCVYMDESGNGSKSDPLIVGGAVLTENFEEVEGEIKDLYHEYSAEVGYDGLKSFELFKSRGFHAAEDPFEISVKFFDFISKIVGLRCFVMLTDQHRPSLAGENDLMVDMYVRLLRDIIRKYRKCDEIQVFIEENHSLEKRLPEIESRVRTGLGKILASSSAPAFMIGMSSKKDPHSMAIIDYVMIAVKRWWQVRLKFDLDPTMTCDEKRAKVTDVANNHVRTFNQISGALSMVRSLEYGIVFNRKFNQYRPLV
ncbi:DUF3800 domain-containing protein [Rhodococcus sp. DT1]|uniref:DUF3800 domain-containing protein n=1 Tax=Rhodococcus sp. DT1 TaxID=3416544 RepID=UPI003CFAE7F6